MEDGIGYFERMLAENPDDPMGPLVLANEYGKARGRGPGALRRDPRYECNERQHTPYIKFRSNLTKVSRRWKWQALNDALGRVVNF
ncbi:MAG TPA: hypothetical protein VF068_10700 [Rubrobacter sp.]